MLSLLRKLSNLAYATGRNALELNDTNAEALFSNQSRNGRESNPQFQAFYTKYRRLSILTYRADDLLKKFNIIRRALWLLLMSLNLTHSVGV